MVAVFHDRRLLKRKNKTTSMSDIKERFLDKVQMEPNSGCWLWTGTTNAAGYGGFVFNKRKRPAHRVAYELFCDEIPEGLVIDHLCRVRCCVNPDHLEPVSFQENVRRGDQGKHRAAIESAKTCCPKGHEYTPENTRVYKTSRFCKKCAREQYKKWRAKNIEKVRAYMRDYQKKWKRRQAEAADVVF
jgi:hypothetical protein